MKQQTIPIEKAIEIATEMHRAGQFERAQAMYVDVLRQDPGNVDAIHLLGVLANQGGRPDVALQLIERALSKRPDEPVILMNYADALSADKQYEKAVEHYRKALHHAPEHIPAWNNLAQTLAKMGLHQQSADAAAEVIKLDEKDSIALNHAGNAMRALNRDAEAIPFYRGALETDPNFAEALNNLGLSLAGVGHHLPGIEKLREAIRLQPGLAGIHVNLAALYGNIGMLTEAVASLETAIKLEPDNTEARNNLSAVLRMQGKHKDSLEELDELAKRAPDYFPMQINFAHIYREMGRLDDALAAYDKFLEKRPEDLFALYMRALVLRDLRRPDEAVVALRDILKDNPDRADVLSTLGYALQERGELDEALEILNRSISLQTDPQTHSNVMMVMCYHPHVSPQQHLAAHRTFAIAHEEPLKPFWKPHSNSRDPDRRLRIGYFSPDMRGHVVSYFSSPIFENHDHDRYEVFAYSNHFQQDLTTLMQRARFDHWREIAGKSYDAVADFIREDQIDILVELAGHTGGNGLAVLARRPAPLQLNAIGFPSTTGLTSVDYRLTDRMCDPPGIAEAHNSEKLLYMPDCFWVYQPPIEEVPITALPADTNGYVTFVSVNNFTKVTPQVLTRWAQITAATKGSKILLQTSGLASAFVKQRVLGIFAEQGVTEDRIDMRLTTPFVDYLRLITSCDIMLDPFPFNGGTTTCHGLWMGTPVVTLAGAMHAGRMGLSMMSCIGLPELVANDEEDYVRIATALAGDLPRLREIRSTMRERLQASPLLDAPRYVRNLEAAYRAIWKQWCADGER